MDYLTVSSPTAVALPSGPIISDVELAHKAKNLLGWKFVTTPFASKPTRSRDSDRKGRLAF